MDTLSFAYRLPVTKVTIGGKRTRVSNPHANPEQVITRTSSIALEIAADERGWLRLSVADEQFDKRRLEVALLPDSRLGSINSAIDDQSPERTKAAIKLGFATAGFLAPALAMFGPVGLAAAAVTGTAAGGAAYLAMGVRALTGSDFVVELGSEPPPRPPLVDLGVPAAYVAANQSEAEVLGSYRWSEMVLVALLAQLTTPRSAGSPITLADDLRAAQKSLSIVRGGLLEAERTFAEWLATHSNTTIDAFHETFFLDELPTTKELHAEAAKKFPFNGPRWGPLFGT